MIAREVSLLLDEEFLNHFLALDVLHMFPDHEPGRDDRIPLLDLGNQGLRVAVHLGKLELRNLLELFLGRLDLGGIKAGNLDQDTTVALGGDDRLAHAELVDTLADDLDGLLKHVSGDFLTVLGHQLKKEGGAAAQIETELDLLFGRGRRIEAEQEQQDRQHGAEPTLFPVTLRGKIPGEETEHEESEEEGEKWRHGCV